MKKYILTDDIYCELLTKSKKELIDYMKQHYKKGAYSRIDSLKDIQLWYIKYNANKIRVDDFFGDVLAMDKKTENDVDYKDYEKYGIKDGQCKKDFLYYNL